MILPILLYTNKILNNPCKPVTDFQDPSLQPLVENMIETMQANNGVGLAANQVGVDKQIAILHVENRTKIMIVVNPKLLKYSKEKSKLNEGCLSCPGISMQMKRYRAIEVECQNLDGEAIHYEFTEYDARIFLHEFSHLQGQTIASTLKNYANVL